MSSCTRLPEVQARRRRVEPAVEDDRAVPRAHRRSADSSVETCTSPRQTSFVPDVLEGGVDHRFGGVRHDVERIKRGDARPTSQPESVRGGLGACHELGPLLGDAHGRGAARPPYDVATDPSIVSTSRTSG